jgi:hypothetical protein
MKAWIVFNSPDLAIAAAFANGQLCTGKTHNHHHKSLIMKLNSIILFCALIALAGGSASCKKSISAAKPEVGAETLSGIAPVPPYTWSQLATPGDGTTYPSNQPRLPIFTVPVGNTYLAWTGSHIYELNRSTMSWERHYGWKLNEDFVREHILLFSWQSKMYFGLDNGNGPGFYELDPNGYGQLTTLSPFPGADSAGGSPETFVVGDYGYLFFGGTYGPCWRYHFPSNTWANVGRNPLGKRHNATIVVMGDKVYAGLGSETVTFGGQTVSIYKKDWIQFTPGSSWSAVKAPFPGDYRSRTQHFVIGDNIYVGFGYHYSPNNTPTVTLRRTDIWKYNTTSNTWGRVADFPGSWVSQNPDYYENIAAFAIGNSGYVVTGGLNEFWRYANSPLITTETN